MNDSPIMRRCKDDWVNATQILKCCNFPKAKRTKILEKGVQTGRHEKVQGGFGRFQGTWIPLEDARNLAALYGVTADQAPVIFMDVSDPNLHIPAKQKTTGNKDPTPIKRKYTRRPKKSEETPTKKTRLDNGASQPPSAGQIPQFSPTQVPQFSPQMYISPQQQQQHQQQMGPPPGFPYKPQPPPVMGNVAISMSQQQEFMQRARMQQAQRQGVPQPHPHAGQNHPGAPLTPMANGPGHGQHPNSHTPQHMRQMQQQPPQYYTPQHAPQQQHMSQGPPPRMPPQFAPQSAPTQGFDSLSSQSANGTWSQDDLGAAPAKESDTSMSSQDDVKPPVFGLDIPEDSSYSAQLLKFFAEDDAEIPYFIHNPPYDFNINEPIDDEGHTPLHWAASIGNYHMIYLLVQKGANILAVNSFGLNPLSKLISFNNCYELKNFPQVLELMDKCLSNTDINGRTPLHYLCQFAKVPSKLDSLKYYLAICLNKLRVLSSANDQVVDLMANVINHQDVNGDTCLHLAAKSRSAEVCSMLLQVGARDDLENSQKETASEIISQFQIGDGGSMAQKSAPGSASQSAAARGAPASYVDTTSMSMSYLPHSSDQFVMATPVQARSNHTPDTQRTTVQSDDMDEDSARVDKKHLDKLMENKENFDANGKAGSVPATTGSHGAPLHPSKSQPQAAPAPSTPSVLGFGMSTPAKTNLASLPAISEHSTPETRTRGHPQMVSNHRPQAPKVSEGKLEGQTPSALALSDLATMLTGMVGSLADTYANQMDSLDKKKAQLEAQVAAKRKTDRTTQAVFSRTLAAGGLTENDYTSVQDGKDKLVQKAEESKADVDKLAQRVSRVLRKLHTQAVTSRVEDLEQQHMAEDGNQGDDDELASEEQWSYAQELCNLQIKQSQLMDSYIESIKVYGVDEKMYKYRKLISLSCGLRVEDIDGYIDGIEESLAESS
ncbi:hypothetical protein DIURU_005664 [Diutina rugosa]|uniref:HTH APSES-type domain-containing protein n=1 Tax=Diutina rugosa TaxID=5481 RepID=A0A642UCF2_DIURU|nr:uncharacterized protein DIURU_005664 [Diutina rugosa]KAA8896652.1 hypothetical protein DIURU_005664 [Diutina rugosa]